MVSLRKLACALLAVLPFASHARQIPVIDGIIAPGLESLASLAPIRAAAPPWNHTVGGLRYVENSGVCETTPGVYQASGYADIAYNQSLFFWYFEARNSPETAPFSIWMNGGPGSSSMIGLFQEHGPCRVTLDGTNVTLNPYSWNEHSNMLYIDQPVTVGFSYGTAEVGTSQEAAAAVWTMLQIFLSDSKFSHLASREFAVWTESYGGHYGPTTAFHILQQNAAIDAGFISGIRLNLKVLGIGNGLTDPLVQYPQYLQYAISNPYRSPLQNATILAAANASLYNSTGCLYQIQSCYDTSNTTICATAQQYCNNRVLSPLVQGWDDYDVRSPTPDPYPPDITALLNSPWITTKIGIPSFINWTETSYTVYYNFAATGDWMTNSAYYLNSVIDSGVRTTMYDGDADYICNYKGFEAVADALITKFSGVYAANDFTNWTVAGNMAGWYKNAGTYSFVRVQAAGHEVPAYGNGNLAKGEAALEFFTQTMKGLPISST